MPDMYKAQKKPDTTRKTMSKSLSSYGLPSNGREQGNKPISRYAIGEGTLKSEDAGRKRLSEEKSREQLPCLLLKGKILEEGSEVLMWGLK